MHWVKTPLLYLHCMSNDKWRTKYLMISNFDCRTQPCDLSWEGEGKAKSIWQSICISMNYYYQLCCIHNCVSPQCGLTEVLIESDLISTHSLIQELSIGSLTFESFVTFFENQKVFGTTRLFVVSSKLLLGCRSSTHSKG